MLHRTQQDCHDPHRARGAAVTAATRLGRDAQGGGVARLIEISLCAALLMCSLPSPRTARFQVLQ